MNDWVGTGQIWIGGHRGSPRIQPQNTPASFDAAIAAGAEVVELDVRRTLDGVLVVFHDATVGGAAGSLRRVPVASLTYDEFCERLAATPGGKRRGRLVATVPAKFEDVVRHLAGRIRLDVEIKDSGHEAATLEILAQHMPSSDYVITSFKEPVVATCKELAPQVRVGLLLGSRGAGQSLGVFPFGRAKACGADFLVAHHLLADASLLIRAARRDMPVVVYTVNRARRLEVLLRDPRVAGVITDVPELAVRIRAAIAAEPGGLEG